MKMVSGSGDLPRCKGEGAWLDRHAGQTWIDRCRLPCGTTEPAQPREAGKVDRRVLIQVGTDVEADHYERQLRSSGR